MDYPLWVIFWRKICRSFKRAIGVGEQGAAPEKWYNVKNMLKKTIKQFYTRKDITELTWKLRSADSCNKNFVRISWPQYYKVC